MPLHWLSFCDPDKPKGEQFLGAAIVDAPSFGAAVLMAHLRGCNPGGECCGAEIPPHLNVPAEFLHRLLTRDEIDIFDARMSTVH